MARSARSAHQNPTPFSFRPELELLEDRITPSTTGPLVALGSGDSQGGLIDVLTASDNTLVRTIQPYANYTGGVRVAFGDVTGDGVDDLITATTQFTPHIKVFDCTNDFAEVRSFLSFENFANGISIAAGNLDGDEFADIVIGAGGAAPHILVISGAGTENVQANGVIDSPALLASFFAFEPTFLGGVVVATADIDQNGQDDILVGTRTGSSHVLAIDSNQLDNTLPNGRISDAALLASFLAFDPSFQGGISLSGGDYNSDGQDDIMVGSGEGTRPHIIVFDGGDITNILDSFFAGTEVGRGVQVGTVDPTVDVPPIYGVDTGGVRLGTAGTNLGVDFGSGPGRFNFTSSTRAFLAGSN